MYVYVYIYVYMYNSRVHVFTWSFMYVSVYMYVYIVYVHTHTHTHKHTHTTHTHHTMPTHQIDVQSYLESSILPVTSRVPYISESLRKDRFSSTRRACAQCKVKKVAMKLVKMPMSVLLVFLIVAFALLIIFSLLRCWS